MLLMEDMTPPAACINACNGSQIVLADAVVLIDRLVTSRPVLVI